MKPFSSCLLGVVGLTLTATAQVNSGDLEVSPGGPLSSLQAALRRIRLLRQQAELKLPLTVWVRGGTYAFERPVEFSPEDSGPITFAAYPGEQPIFDAGRRITGFQRQRINGVEAWVADVAGLLAQHGRFRSLFVNGGRRERPRLPKKGYYRILDVPGQTYKSEMAGSSDTLVVKPGEVRNWKNLHDVEVRVLHFWTDERMPIESVDETTGLVKCSRKSVFGLSGGYTGGWSQYWVENVFEALTEPGEWYLDAKEARLYYIPMPGETMNRTEVVAAGAFQFLRLMGDPEKGRFVTGLTFQGLTFRFSDWIQPEHDGLHFDPYVPAERRLTQDSTRSLGGRPGTKLAATPQISIYGSGVISFAGVHNSAVVDCRLEHIGFWGIALLDGSRNNRIEGNTVIDAGGGGIKVDGADYPSNPARFCAGNRITDSVVRSLGRVFTTAAGIAVTHGFGNLIAHNEISDLYQTGISVGWQWARQHTVSRDNRVEKNHIFNLGQGLSSDLAGVYLLGVQPGTMVRNNLIHGVEHAHYGGWGIYPDAASAHVLIENNVVYDVSAQTIMPNAVSVPTNREIIVRNNVFAFGRQGLARVPERYSHKAQNIPGKAATFERNIFLANGGPVYVAQVGPAGEHPKNELFISDLNVIWDVSGKSPLMNREYAKGGPNGPMYDVGQWQALGSDRHSLFADPRFKDWKNRDFRLEPGSPAFEVGFEPIDLSDVGPRPKDKRQ